MTTALREIKSARERTQLLFSFWSSRMHPKPQDLSYLHCSEPPFPRISSILVHTVRLFKAISTVITESSNTPASRGSSSRRSQQVTAAVGNLHPSVNDCTRACCQPLLVHAAVPSHSWHLLQYRTTFGPGSAWACHSVHSKLPQAWDIVV